MGRPKNIHTPIKHFSEEERKQAIKQSKTKYMLNKEWRCPLCDNRDYSLAGKWCHLNTRKHMINAEKHMINAEKHMINAEADQ